MYILGDLKSILEKKKKKVTSYNQDIKTVSIHPIILGGWGELRQGLLLNGEKIYTKLY